MTWPTVPASELILKRGGSVNPSKFPDETFELLSIPAFDKNEPEILSGSEIGSSKSCIEPGDVLLSKIVPHIRRCWVVPEKREYRQIGSGEWIIFRDDRFDKGFLKHFLTSDIFHRQFMNTVAGVGGSLVRARPAEVERIEIPLPPLAEQKRIATILDKADAIRRKRQQAIQLADDFLRAVFLDMFGDPVTNPKGWELSSLRDLINLQGGFAFKSGDFSDSGIPVVKIGNANKVGFTTKEISFISPEKPEKLLQYELYPGDLLISLTGTVGKDDYANVTEVTDDYEKYYLNQRVAKITINSNSITKAYLRYILSHPKVKSEITKNNRGVRQANISNGDIYGLSIPIPRSELLNGFSEIVSKSNALTPSIHKSLELEKSFFSSLSQKAFRGEL